MTVANIGTADAGRFVVAVSGRAFIVDGAVVAGSSTTVSFDCRTGPLTATADSTDRVVELDETNKARTAGPFDCASPSPSPSLTASPSVTPTKLPSMPDLTVSGLFADGVRVRNQGDAAAGTFVVGVTNVGTFTVKSLGPGQSVFRGFPCAAGTLTATADARHKVAESDEGNNVRSGGLFTCLPGLVAAELTGSTVTVMNIGVGPAGPSIVTLGGLVLQVPSLDPNGAVRLRYQCIGGTVTAFADANDDVTESNESNNTLTKDVGIC